MAVIDRKHYRNKLESAVAERAETLGLARDVSGFFEYVGYLKVQNDDASKTLYLITIRNDNGAMGNVITKSDNVIKQLDDIIDTVGDYNRKEWKIGFSEQRTKSGNNVIIVNMTMTSEAEPTVEKREDIPMEG